MMTNKWINYFFKVAEATAELSKDPRTRVGAVLVNETDNTIVATGFNGFPRNVADTLERYNDRTTKHKLVCHAEVNAIINAARNGVITKDTTLFVTLPPCISCAKIIIQAGISCVFYKEEQQKKEENTSTVETKNNKELLCIYFPKQAYHYFEHKLSDFEVKDHATPCTKLVIGTAKEFTKILLEMYADWDINYYGSEQYDCMRYIASLYITLREYDKNFYMKIASLEDYLYNNNNISYMVCKVVEEPEPPKANDLNDWRRDVDEGLNLLREADVRVMAI